MTCRCIEHELVHRVEQELEYVEQEPVLHNRTEAEAMELSRIWCYGAEQDLVLRG
jgi:hypothetical protein